MQEFGQALLAARQLGGIGLLIGVAAAAHGRFPFATALAAPLLAAIGITLPVAGLGQRGLAPVGTRVMRGIRYGLGSCLSLIFSNINIEIIRFRLIQSSASFCFNSNSRQILAIGCVVLEKRIVDEHLLDFLRQLQRGQLQQLYRLLQLRRERQVLRDA